MPMPMHTVIYENVVADRQRGLAGLFDFLELDWHDAVLDHQSTARSRGRIKTASYAQVIEPVSKGRLGRWKHYEQHFGEALGILEPWIRRWGYSLD